MAIKPLAGLRDDALELDAWDPLRYGYVMGRNTMAGTKVTREQFEILENSVVHKPTGARFTAYPGRPEIDRENVGRAGDVLENGDDYRLDEIRDIAALLLRERLKG